jgi:UDP-N-acetyl-D-galactosamine dehydrogenase
MNNYKIAIIGLGYVGLPLAIEFDKKYSTIGFDINNGRIDDLKNGIDNTNEVETDILKESKIKYTTNPNNISEANIYIITVPTPINEFKQPDLSYLKSASKTVGEYLKKGDIVIYESTVYPGCTEDDCVPILELQSGLKFNRDFYCGYSPERINPGDRVNTLTKIKKVTSGSTPEIAKVIDKLYLSIIMAGTHLAPSIRVAEASKAIENAQRDVNISFINELSLIFDKMNIDTHDVLDAAATKWNFLNYKPGLVGGHCISVDPYYLAHKSKSLGYDPEVILSGRKINDRMGKFVARKVIKLLIEQSCTVKGSDALILGITFKENCPDIRNTKVLDMFTELNDFGVNVDIYDPHAIQEEVKNEFNIQLLTSIGTKKYHAIILAVSHDEFLNIDYKKLRQNKSVIFDIKSYLDRRLVDARL